MSVIAFHEKAGRSQVVIVVSSLDRVLLSRRVTTPPVTLPSALWDERLLARCKLLVDLSFIFVDGKQLLQLRVLGFAFFLDVGGDSFPCGTSQPDCSLDVYRKLLIRTTSLVRIPLATNNCFPSRDHEKPKMCPEVKSVI
jgi:hypothetical protein